ncbi:MAG TPA: hypothetical protein VFV83_03895 [Chthoniobacteraceae bacterium]|nr:hypothetical protein [Chthoniobacteraceae bacterium]
MLEANPELTAPFKEQMYVSDVVFTTGIVDEGDHYIVASGEADLLCRITRFMDDPFGGRLASLTRRLILAVAANIRHRSWVNELRLFSSCPSAVLSRSLSS